MRRTLFLTSLFLGLVVAGGHVWLRTDAAATARADYLASPFSEDDTVTVAFSPSGILNQDVRIIAYDFGSEDPVLEDVYADQITHGKLRDDFYTQGFRRVISGNRVSRIVDALQKSSTKQKNESGDFAVRAAVRANSP